MIDVLIWWLLLELVGIAVLPIAFRFFRNLPDRVYAFIKPLGLLLIAYPFWLLTALGFLTNTRGAIAVVAVTIAILSWWLGSRSSNHSERPVTNHENPSLVSGQPSVLAWARSNLSLILTTEIIFTLAFLAWTIVRAYMPEITATEKPMEFAFLNGVLQSERFPPLDPWLAGYGISYYYFGYIIIAMLTMLTGITPSIAFNLAIATLFGLAATCAFGLAFNLIRLSRFKVGNLQAFVYALAAPIFLLVVGNLEGLFEVLRARGIGSIAFWTWLDVRGLAQAASSNTFEPTDNWWWWRASRVIHDVALGQTQEVIDEFPQFSFLLGDMHPHVLALPFALLALATALNLLNSEFDDHKSKFPNLFLTLDFLLLPLTLGGLFFLNSWDILPYGFILLAAFTAMRYRAASKWNGNATRDLISFAVALGVASIVMYLPFFIGFQSQAGGILPVLFVKTRLHQFLLMFGLFVFILSTFVARAYFDNRGISLGNWLRQAAPFFAATIVFPLVVAVLALIVIAVRPDLQDQARAALPSASDNLLALLLGSYIGPWLTDPWLFLLLALFLAAIAVLIKLGHTDATESFVLILALTGFLLTLGVEFAYLRDQFGTRMNTVFKFYFQAWTLFSIASAYAVFYLARRLRGIARVAWGLVLLALIGASLVYPRYAIPNRANDFRGTPTLDGIAWIRDSNPEDYAAIQWLIANAPRGATTLEAPGGEYSYGNRISMATGLPTVLGWGGHESQWRGNSNLFHDPGNGIDRAGDVQRIYKTLDAKELLTLLDKYAIKFVVVGATERSQYSLTKPHIDKFAKSMSLVFESGDTKIFAR